LDRARQAGHSVAIDDFGTGYSNLQGLPLDAIKIDMSFVQMIGQDTATSSVIELIIDLTKKLDSFSVAEGVETEEQAAFLTARGVTYAQGWLFSKPLGGTEFIAYQNERKRIFGSSFQVLPNIKKPNFTFDISTQLQMEISIAYIKWLRINVDHRDLKVLNAMETCQLYGR